ncbi:MAG: FtsX-like permease family protein [Bacteroidota bacterium]
MNLPFNIARKYFFSKKKSGSYNAITVISSISLLGYVVGTCALIIILSVFNGFENLFANMYSNFDAQLQVTALNTKTFSANAIPFNSIQQIDGIATYSKVLEENVLLKYSNKTGIATAKAVDENYLKVAHIDTCIEKGVALIQSGDTNFALCGEGLAYQLGIDPDNQFDFLSIYAPKKGEVNFINPENAFNRELVIPTGIFAIQPEIDNKFILVPLRFLNALLEKENQISAIEIKLKPDASITQVKAKLSALMGPQFIVKNRFEQREAFYKLVKTEKLISYIIILFILVIAIFNTVGTLFMLVMEKEREIKILHSMGFNANSIANIFAWQSLFIACVGGIIGIILGAVISFVQQTFGFIKISAESTQAYPIAFAATDAIIVFITIFVLGLITAIYPWLKAKKIASYQIK